ncbi:MAG: hypothetical protein ACK5HS_05355 [Mycoplasmatales bacterium]
MKNGISVELVNREGRKYIEKFTKSQITIDKVLNGCKYIVDNNDHSWSAIELSN